MCIWQHKFVVKSSLKDKVEVIGTLDLRRRWFPVVKHTKREERHEREKLNTGQLLKHVANALASIITASSIYTNSRNPSH